jgi:adenylosuccinate synthase
MSRTTQVVIGANFGDEGKGLFTDYFCDSTATVVRFNGGAQAGHTVELADGRRHVFSHFGAGSFRGARTYLSRFFVCNPLLFARERAELARLGVTPDVIVDGDALVTTPYDMMVNQIVEEARGAARHGSVGVGFGETVGREEETPYSLRVADLARPDLAARLALVREQWLPARLKQLGVEQLTPQWQERVNAPAVSDGFIGFARAMLQHCEVAHQRYLASARSIVFEGAQGLMLDQDHHWFPHVTRSSTGLRNVVTLADEAGINQLDVLYATRSYLTRHGAGPLPHEVSGKIYSNIIDKTNKPHPFQGSLRFAPLNLDLLQANITNDLRYAAGRVGVNLHLGISCMDQLDAHAQLVSEGSVEIIDPDALVDVCSARINPAQLLLSYGPTRETVSELQNDTVYA